MRNPAANRKPIAEAAAISKKPAKEAGGGHAVHGNAPVPKRAGKESGGPDDPLSDLSMHTCENTLKIGERFNPSWKLCGFNPAEALATCQRPKLTDGQKRLYEWLVDRSGDRGYCWYSYDVIAGYLGKPVRTVKLDMKNLVERWGLIEIIHRYKRRADGTGGRDSNRYHFLWQPILDQGKAQLAALKTPSWEKVAPAALAAASSSALALSAKSGQVECKIQQGKVPPIAHVSNPESIREFIPRDYDQLPQNHQNRDSAPADGSFDQSMRLIAERLEAYYGRKPPDWICAGLLAAADCEGYGADEVIETLDERWNAGYRPGKKTGPESWKWFEVTVRDRLHQRREQERAFQELGAPHWKADVPKRDPEPFDDWSSCFDAATPEAQPTTNATSGLKATGTKAKEHHPTPKFICTFCHDTGKMLDDKHFCQACPRGQKRIKGQNDYLELQRRYEMQSNEWNAIYKLQSKDVRMEMDADRFICSMDINERSESLRKFQERSQLKAPVT